MGSWAAAIVLAWVGMTSPHPVFELAVAPSGRAQSPGAKVAVIAPRLEGQWDERRTQVVEQRLLEGLAGGGFDLISPEEAGRCAGPSCYAEVGQRTGARLVVVTTVVARDRDFEIEIEVVRTRDGSRIARVVSSCSLCGIGEVGDIVAGQATTLRAKVDALASGAPVMSFVGNVPGIAVTIDDRMVGTTPLSVEVEPGQHVVVARKPGYREQEFRIVAIEGVEESIEFSLEAAPPRWIRPARISGGVLVGVGVAGIATGAVLIALDGRQYRARCDPDLNGTCRNLYNTQPGGIAAVTVGGVAAIAGAALLIAAAVKDPTKRQRGGSRAAIRPAGLGLRAQF